MKLCTDCREVKPLDHFHKDRNKKDGRVCMCKPCTSIYQKWIYERDKHDDTKQKYYRKGIGKVTAKEDRETKINLIRYRFKLWQEHGEFR